MLFSSMLFLWIFLPVVIIGNFILSVAGFKEEETRIRAKNVFLLVASLIFYAWGDVNYLFIMLSSIALNYVGGRIIGDAKTHRKGKLALVVALNLGILFVFKYFNMVVVVIESILSFEGNALQLLQNMLSMQGTGELGLPYIVLPIGISFFTFQAMSYVIDVYYEKTKVQKSLFAFALYVSFFPQLVAGPIVKYSDIAEQLKKRKETVATFVSGQKRFCYGLAKKVLLANTFAEVADKIWSLETSALGAGVAWLGILAYTLQIYYDFSGYSDMAIGIGRMLGFEFKENFNYPYTSLSVQEFWRRWHISLSTWFKEYVYIPLGGNRRGNKRTYLNIFIVFFLTGVWHGANFTFFVWGMMYALLQILERLFLGKWLEKNPVKIINWIYCMLAVMVGWVFFRADTVFQAITYLQQMFAGSTSYYTVISFLSMKVIVVFAIGILFAGGVQRLLKEKYEKVKYSLPVMACDLCIQAVTLVLCIFMMVSGTYNPFIYFQF